MLGIWTMIFLFLGFPFFWDKIIALVTGVFVILCAYSIRNANGRQNISGTNDTKKHSMPYVEHRGVPSRSIADDMTTTG